MSTWKEIFEKERLTPGQLRSVAERRFEDAVCLLESGQNARTTGAIYVGGFAIECLLKAALLKRHPNLKGSVDPARLSPSDREVFELLYGHELDEMLLFLPEVEAKLTTYSGSQGRTLWEQLREICEEWTVYARYSPRLAKPEEARRFINVIREVKECLKQY